MKILKRIRDQFEWQRKIRRIEVSRAGKWYIVLTIALGVVALASGNNVIYLIESLLLSGLILSGVLSEQAISAVRIEFIRLQAKALAPTNDYITITNTTRRSLFCLEIGEWNGGDFNSLGFIPTIGPKKTARIRSHQTLNQRGLHRWDGFAIATSYPFGFAKKIKVVKIPGSRLVWPVQEVQKTSQANTDLSRLGYQKSELEIVDGELRAYDIHDDARLVIAKQSAKGGTPLVRNRRAVMREPEVIFDLRLPRQEADLNQVASIFYHSPDAELLLIDPQGRKKIRGQKLALNMLATVNLNVSSQPNGHAP
jgi:uncharacterized protein (DUF58 family)